MSKFAIIRFVCAIGLLALPYATDLKEPLVKWIFDRYHVRYVTQWDAGRSILSIGLHNASPALGSPIRLDVSPSGQAADFECGAFPGGPAVSFLSIVSTLPSFSHLPGDEAQQFGRYLDVHAGPTHRIREISETWKSIILHGLSSASPARRAYDPDTVLQAHTVLLTVCQSADNGPCRDERELERWERLEYAMQSEATQAWEKATGVGVAFQGDEAWPSKGLTFWVVPGPGAEEARFITVRYESGASRPSVAVKPEPETLTQVEDASDLYASTALLVWKHDRVRVLLLGFSTLAGLIVAYPLLSRYSKEPIDRLFRIGLANPAEKKAWDALYAKLKLALIDDFRQACLARGKPAPPLPATELFEHLRNRALVENPSFDGEKDVDRFVHVSMGELADHV